MKTMIAIEVTSIPQSDEFLTHWADAKSVSPEEMACDEIHRIMPTKAISVCTLACEPSDLDECRSILDDRGWKYDLKPCHVATGPEGDAIHTRGQFAPTSDDAAEAMETAGL